MGRGGITVIKRLYFFLPFNYIKGELFKKVKYIQTSKKKINLQKTTLKYKYSAIHLSIPLVS